MSELTKEQQAEVTQASQVAGARDDGFNRFLEDAFAEAERIQSEWGKKSAKVEPRLTVSRRDGIV
jgi:hypothetical protein